MRSASDASGGVGNRTCPECGIGSARGTSFGTRIQFILGFTALIEKMRPVKKERFGPEGAPFLTPDRRVKDSLLQPLCLSAVIVGALPFRHAKQRRFLLVNIEKSPMAIALFVWLPNSLVGW